MAQKPGTFNIEFKDKKKLVSSVGYELKPRVGESANRVGFNNSDVIYLITPDRFVNGNPLNDELPEMKEKVAAACRNAETGCTECKKILGESLVKFLAPLQEKRRYYLENKKMLHEILEEGCAKATKVALSTMKEVRQGIGLPDVL